MSLHITRFLDRIKAAESRQQREVTMTVIEAKDLHTDITKLLLKLEDTREQLSTAEKTSVTEVEIQGGSF